MLFNKITGECSLPKAHKHSLSFSYTVRLERSPTAMIPTAELCRIPPSLAGSAVSSTTRIYKNERLNVSQALAHFVFLRGRNPAYAQDLLQL